MNKNTSEQNNFNQRTLRHLEFMFIVVVFALILLSFFVPKIQPINNEIKTFATRVITSDEKLKQECDTISTKIKNRQGASWNSETTGPFISQCQEL